MLRAIFTLFLLAVAFGAGYFYGTAGTKEVKKSYSTLREELFTKTRGLESEVYSMRVRLNLIEAREFLMSARNDLKEKNFGEAVAQAGKAKERITKAISLAPETQKKNLAPLQTEIDSLRESIQKLDPKAVGRIDALAKELEKVAG
ncbi:MAG: hypothetical protein HY282_15150 [Nitrospirae bacterium]|nr:hypothetical protein [Candidatus Manganitrophaceae bacterium]